MKKKFPILIVIPHGGLNVPAELSGLHAIDKFTLFVESDTCANDLFSFDDEMIAKIDADISRLFVDLDRHPFLVPPRSNDGVIKKESIDGKKIFINNVFPDEIAITNILKRYYFPFHNTIEKIINTGAIRFIIECHTVMAVGPKNSLDSGRPRPIAIVENIIEKKGSKMLTCPDEFAVYLLESLERSFSDENSTVAQRFTLNKPIFNGYILKKYGLEKIPMIRLSISRSLFLNDKYFS